MVFRRLLDLHVTGKGSHYGLVDTLRLELLDDLGDDCGERHRWRDDGMPVAEEDRVDARIFEREP